MSGAPQRVVATAPGKINLSLRVGAADERGYHALATVFQAVDLLETVEARLPQDPGALTLTVDSRVRGDVPVDASNLALRAAALLRAETGTTQGAALHITKRVPVAGGMGGGSADAAAALVALNRLWRLGLSDRELMLLGAGLGADVPFAVLGGTALGTGNGDQLQRVPAPAPLTWLLCAPGGHLATPEVFRAFDALAAQADAQPPRTPRADQHQLAALAAGDREAIARSLANELHEPAVHLRPDLQEILSALREHGALGAIVSGSGPTLAALVRDAQHGEEVSARVREDRGDLECTLTRSSPYGARIVAVD